MVKCASDGCQRNSDPNKNGLCGVCHRVIVRFQQNRNARDQQVNDRQGIDNNEVPNIDNVVEFPDPATVHLPPLDMTEMNRLYQQVADGEMVDNAEVMKSAFGMMMHVAASLNTVNKLKTDIRSNSDRISSLEAKVGGQEEVAVPLGLAIQNLPLPNGVSEIENVRDAISEIGAPNVITNIHITKVIRKGHKAETRPGANDGRLGTVLVEVSTTDVKAAIMKSKKRLENHVNPVMKNLKIKNMKSQEQMNQEFATRQLLKMVPGGNQWYVAGNGQLKPTRGGVAPEGGAGGGAPRGGARVAPGGEVGRAAQQFRPDIPPPQVQGQPPVAAGPGVANAGVAPVVHNPNNGQ